MKRALALTLVMVVISLMAFAQDAPKPPRPSPPQKTEFTFADGKKITIDYSSPSMKGRKIFGGLVPYDKVWRTGANEATSLKTDTNLEIGGTKVPAGSYTIYTLPSDGTWKLIINQQTGQWGTVYDEKQDLARVDMKGSKTPAAVEQFKISLDKANSNAATLNLDWENTRQSVTIKEAGTTSDMPVQK